MTISRDTIADRPGPRYRAIADAFAEAISRGGIPTGSRLPTHRGLAWQLGVTVGTVTRAYGELTRRGLAHGEVGRGTFVGGIATGEIADIEPPEDGDVIDLGLNHPPAGRATAELARTLAGLAGDPGLEPLLEYHDHAGTRAHRAAGAAWIALGGYAVPAERIIVTVGAQHGIFLALSAVARAGDKVGAEALSYPGLMAAAKLLGIRIEPLDIDGDGLVPEAVEAACRAGIGAICCVPSLHNPTAAIMPPERRAAIAAIVRRHRAVVIEDDIFGYLLSDPPTPIASLAPENAIYLTSLSKTVAPGLRVGYLAAPPAFFERARRAARATCWMTPPLVAEIAARWIADGTAERVLDAHRAEAAARMAMAREILAPWRPSAPDGAMHLWLQLPEPWREEDFVAAARARGVGLRSSAPFTLSQGAANAARVCLGPPATRALLRTALEHVAALLREGPANEADATLSVY